MEVRISRNVSEGEKQVRQKVFVEEQGFEEEFDDLDDISIHITVLDKGKTVGVCRIFYDIIEKCFLIGRVAVLPEYRNKKIGQKLLKYAEAYAVQRGQDRVCVHSQLQAQGFYEKLGYQSYGNIYFEEGCPHISMQKNLD